MNKSPKLGLRISQQIILTSLVPLILMSVLATVLSTYVLLESSLPMILQENTSEVQIIASDLAENLKYYQRSLETTSVALGRYGNDSQQQKQMLKDFITYLVRFDGGVTLLDSAGIAIASTPGHELRLGFDYSSYDYFQTARRHRQTTFSRVILMQPENRKAVVISTPVIHNSDLVGVLIGVFFIEGHNWIKDLGSQFNQQQGQVVLVDVMGDVIFSTNSDYSNSSLQNNAVLWKLVAKGEPQSILSDKKLFGNPNVFSFSPLPGMYWGIILQEPFRIIQVLASPYQFQVIRPIIIGIVVFLILVIISSNQITKPLMALVQGAVNVLNGNPFSSIKVEGPVELRTLTYTFNKLACKLQEQQTVLRQYANQVVQSQEEERKRLSRELHDGVVQNLVALVQRLELSDQFLDNDTERARLRLKEVKVLAEQIVSDMRRISNDLRPFILEDLGLPMALRTLCDDLDQELPDASVQLAICGEEIRLAPEAELTVFRMVQESLSNIRKHSLTASMIEVQLRYEEHGIVAKVTNNGPAFETQEIHTLIREGHLGLAGMMERAHLFGGNIDIGTNSDNITFVTLKLPYKN